ncbi:MAG: 5-(carboxyamino)imidazole ribonucleotide synthase [Myxococcota bacterium]
MPILPGATIGIMGGGQLGRMTAMAARALGYHVQALDPDPSCAARFVVDRCLTAAFDDAEAAAELAKQCQVVTLEIEKVGLSALETASRFAPVRPSPRVLSVVQDRGAQRQWLSEHGFPQGPWRLARSAAELSAAARDLGGRVFVKACQGGYDGRGQEQLDSASRADQVWKTLGEAPCVVEQALALEEELSVLVARSPRGEVAVYPPALNHHVHRVLDWSLLPGPFGQSLVGEATSLARRLAEELHVEGLLVVELFHSQGQLFVNELAPRPHNTFHSTEVGCVTSQFEQLVRAVCDLPLGSTEVTRPAAIVNLLGDLWEGAPPAFDRALAIPGVRVHLYGKRVARPGRKMGHLSAVGRTPEEALERVEKARSVLTRSQR